VTGTDDDALRDRLDALSSRIEKRGREWKQRGAFSGLHESNMDDIRKRSTVIRERLDTAIARGGTWEALKCELERDFHSLNEDFELFEHRLDSSAMTQGR
jgi:hypothetical protein